MHSRTLSVVLLLAMAGLIGCAPSPYEFTRDVEGNCLRLAGGEAQIERGQPIPILDGVGHYVVSLPSKLILWNWKVDNHNISEETEQRLKEYLAENSLNNVKVRLNQYAPGDEWRRLFANKQVGAGWRYTLGVLSVASYTIFPGRFFGGDNYNPYTNTINLYSDHSAIALHEAGHAKDFAQRKYKGTYAAIRMLPIVPLYQESKATGDAIGYVREKGLTDEEKGAYKILYPAYGTYVAGEGLRWMQAPIWVTYPITAACAVVGHVVGRIEASKVPDQPTTATAPAPSPN